jgi:flavodoxin
MKIGIIVYSETDNTYSVATKLYNELNKKCSVNLSRIEATRDKKNGLIKIDNYPDTNCDVIIFASYVEGFALNPVMKKYLTELNTLKDKQILCFVTEAFPYSWMGGNQAIKRMKDICTSKEANIINTGVIHWGKKNREENIDNLIKDFTKTINDIK